MVWCKRLLTQCQTARADQLFILRSTIRLKTMSSTHPRPDRRSRREQEIRGRILEAAIACFLERGYEATTIDEIAERADVARATVFNHYAEKQELLTAYLARRRQELVDLLRREPRADLSARQQLYDALDLLATFNERDVAESRELIGAWWRSGGTTTRDPYTGVVLAELIAAGQRSGEFRSEIDPALVGRLILDAYAGLVLRWVSAPVERPFSLRDALRDIGGVILDGISKPKTKASRATSRR
jgi:TetR/AcrR family transcriptional regulator, cholesterol catabolism regulator